MRVYSGQSVTFNHPSDYDIKHRIQAFKFEDVPAWVADSQMFKLLKQSDKIKIIESSKDVSEIDDADGELINKEMETPEGQSGSQNGTPNYSSMKSKELYSLCIEKGIEVEEKQPKEYYIEKLNA